MKMIWLLLTLVCLNSVVAGCGYKGELHLPGTPEPPPTRSQGTPSPNR